MPPSTAWKPITTPHSSAVAAPARALVLALLRAYKLLISPLFGGCCRYYPSCADYMKDAVVMHGAGRGVWLGVRRLCRCHPFGGHGVDPVPPAFAKATAGKHS